MNQHGALDAGADRLIFLAEAEAGAILGDNDWRGERRADDRIQGALALGREHLPWPQVGRWKGGAR